MDSCVLGDLGDSAAAVAGDEMPVDISIICNSWDMNNGYVSAKLVSESGSSRVARMTRDQLEAEAFNSLVTTTGVQLSNYVDAAYQVKSIAIPEDLVSGVYSVTVYIETEFGEYEFPVGQIDVSAQEKSNKVSEKYINSTGNYAIGFDEPIQPMFRQNNIILTGWVYHREEDSAYFDRYEVLDSTGRKIADGYFLPEELVQHIRANVGADIVGLAPNVEDNAGFVMMLDLSAATLDAGEEYMIQVYSSNATGVSWMTVSATIMIDNNAGEITDESIAAIVESWMPIEETPEPEDTEPTVAP